MSDVGTPRQTWKRTQLLRRLLKVDVVSVVAWQMSNYLIPLVLLPLFGRRLGVEGFGIYGVALGITNLATMVADWGFLYTAQRDIVAARGNREAEEKVVWTTLSAKMFLALLSSCIIIAIAACFGPDSGYFWSLLAGIPAVIANGISLEWLLRGKERFVYFATASIAGRCLSLPLAFLLVTDGAPPAAAMITLSLGVLAAAALSFIFGLRLTGRPKLYLRAGLDRIVKSVGLFLPIAATNFYGVAVTPIVSILAGTFDAGIYAGADRMKGAARMLFYPLTVIAYPKVNAMRLNDPDKLKTFLPQLVLAMAVCAGLVCGLFALAAPFIVQFVLGAAFQGTAVILQLLAAGAFCSCMSSLIGTNILISFGFNRSFFLSQAIGISIALLVIVTLTPFYGAVGAATGALVGEASTLLIQLIAVSLHLPWALHGQRSGRHVA